jgi:hypothetical protein
VVMDGKDAAEADELILQLAMGVGIKGNSYFCEESTFSCVTAAGLTIARSDQKFSEKFKAAAEATTHGVLILAKTKEEYETFLSKGQAHADALENDHVWVLTDDGIFPRRGANKSKGKKDGMIYYGGRDDEGKPNGYGTGYYTNGNKFEGHWASGKKCGHGIYTYSSGEQYQGEMGGEKGYKHGKGKLFKEDGSLKREGTWVEGEFQGDG